MSKKYLNINVYQATQQRLAFIFEEFENVYVAFSGGKDSSVVFHLAVNFLIENNIKKRLGVMFLDGEVQYTATISHVRQMLELYLPYIDIYWRCPPIDIENGVSAFQPTWRCWDKKIKHKWVRQMPNDEGVMNEDNHPDGAMVGWANFGEWFMKQRGGGQTVGLVGIRADESLNRFRTIKSKNKRKYKDKGWTTYVSDNYYSAYPIYDWQTRDIWILNGKYGYCYNRVYDLMHWAGVGIEKMRVCQPYGLEQRTGLEMFKILEPNLWNKAVERVAGANFGNIYCKTKGVGYLKVQLPKGHTWASYTRLLLASTPTPTRDRFVNRFNAWARGMGYESIENMSDDMHDEWQQMARAIMRFDTVFNDLSKKKIARNKERREELINRYGGL
jgi:predicted phosphoadenosine phosphosulfate sulfurtransferase